MKSRQFLLVCFIIIFNSKNIFAQTNERPNIVLILADDLALMDFGIYGGEAATPNIDKLARKGTMFLNYHTSPSCAPSRAMLMTGCDSHLTGVPNLPLFLPPEQESEPGYEGILNDEVRTVATHLKQSGYKTYITGKWHLGHTEKTLPTKRGFDRSFILNTSGADNYEHRPYLPTQSKPPWFEDGKAIELPDDFYSSRNLVDKMIGFMKEEKDKSAPFFSFLSFQAIHIPVQAPKEFIQKYEGVYDEGWDKLRLKRFEKAKALELIPSDSELGAMLPFCKKWDEQSDEEKKLKAKAMAVNAAMIEAMDFHIGRYIQYLEDNGKMENTVFVITSDNGPEASDPSLVAGMNLWLKWVGYSTDYETLGEKGSWNFIGPEFASAAAGPNAFFKFYAGEGGLRVPLIISGNHLPKEQKKNAFTFVTDVTPTILDIAGVEKATNSTIPFTGKSLLPLINNQTEQVYQKEETIGVEAAGHSALFRGDIKIVKNGVPYGDAKWRMYNIKKDPGEINNLSALEPELFKSMLHHYEIYAKEFKVLEMADDYDQWSEFKRKFKVKTIRAILPWMIGLIILVSFFFFRKRRKRDSM